jgi:hypothetical protein
MNIPTEPMTADSRHTLTTPQPAATPLPKRSARVVGTELASEILGGR